MKKHLLSLILFFISTSLFAQISSCFNATPVCSDNVVFSNTINQPSLGYIACLGSTPNPNWYIFKVGTAGQFDFELSQGDNAPLYNNQDIDFILWGPFNDLPNCDSELYSYPNGNTSITNNVVSCSFSAAPIETFNFSGVSEKYYVVLSTNFGNQSGNIWLKQLNSGQAGAGSLICDYVIINSQPTNDDFAINSNATFSVTTLNATTYKWEMSTNSIDWFPINDGGTMPAVSGSETSSLNLSNIPGSYSGNYFRVLATNANDNVYSKVSQLNQTLSNSSFDSNKFGIIYNENGSMTIILNDNSISYGNIEVSIMDIGGKIIKKDKFDSNSYNLTLNEFNSGVYFIELKNNQFREILKIKK